MLKKKLGSIWLLCGQAAAKWSIGFVLGPVQYLVGATLDFSNFDRYSLHTQTDVQTHYDHKGTKRRTEAGDKGQAEEEAIAELKKP